MRIRKANDTDIDLLCEIVTSVSYLYEPFMPGAFSKLVEKFKKQGIPSSYCIEIIEIDSIVIGFIGTKQLHDNLQYLVALYIHDEHQGKGYGSKCLRFIEERFQEDNNDNEIVVLVHKCALWAQAFYKNNGYLFVSDCDNEIREYKNGLIRQLHLKNTILFHKILRNSKAIIKC